MIDITDNGIVSIVAGDTVEFGIMLNDGDKIFPEWYTLNEGDELLFGIMEPNAPFERALVKKALGVEDVNVSGGVTVRLDHMDTALLLPGLYYYEVKLVRMPIGADQPYVDTVVPRRRLYINH